MKLELIMFSKNHIDLMINNRTITILKEMTILQIYYVLIVIRLLTNVKNYIKGDRLLKLQYKYQIKRSVWYMTDILSKNPQNKIYQTVRLSWWSDQAIICNLILERELFIKKISSVLLMNDQMNKTKKSNTSNEVRAISSFGGNTQGDALAISLNRVQGNTLINKLPSYQYIHIGRSDEPLWWIW